MSGIYILMQCW